LYLRCISTNYKISKIIKILRKIVLILLLVILALPAVSYLLLQNNNIQTYLVQYISKEISNTLEAQVTLKRVSISLFNNVILKDLLVKDQHGDTLLAANDLIVGLRGINTRTHTLNVGKVHFDSARINFINDSTRTLNLQFIIDALQQKKDTTSAGRKKWTLDISHIAFTNSFFALTSYDRESQERGINFKAMRLYDLNINLRNFTTRSDTVLFHIKELSFRERSGFILQNLTADMSVSKHNMHFYQVHVVTPNSDLTADKYLMDFNSLQDLSGGSFLDRVKLYLQLKQSDVSFKDIAYFSTALYGADNTVNMSGTIRGYINDLKCRDMEIYTGEKTVLLGDFDFNGLPDVRQTYMYLNVDELAIDKSDIEHIKLPEQTRKEIHLPQALNRFSFIKFKGKFTGFIDDFVTYGKFTTNLGVIKSDLSIKPDTARYIRFKGKLSTSQFDLGRFSDNNKLFGLLTFHADINGYGSGLKNLNATLKGTLDRADIKGYNYQNVHVEGNLMKQAFDGSVSVEDPNLKLDLLGRFDFSSNMPEFDFTANIPKANLFPLNLVKADSTLSLSSIITANFIGNSLDNIDGDIKILNSTFKRKNNELQIYDFSLAAKSRSDSSSIVIRSDFLDANILGQYKFADLYHSLTGFMSNYLPAAIQQPDSILHHEDNNFTFDVDLKNTNFITTFFEPTLKIAKNSTIKGNYDPAAHLMKITYSSDKVNYKGFQWNKPYISILTNDSVFSLQTGSNNLVLNDQMELDNFTIDAGANNNRINLALRWSNWDTILYKGNIRATALLKHDTETEKTSLNIHLNPSRIIVGDSLWTLKESLINIDSGRISIDNFVLNSNSQYLTLNGAISHKQSEKLNLKFRGLQLSNLNLFTAKKGIHLSGTASGEASLANYFQIPEFHSDISIDNFLINNEPFGHSSIRTDWDNKQKVILLDAYTKRGDVATFKMYGTYRPQNKNLDFDIALDRLRMSLFSPFLENIFSDVNGLATGDLRLTGSLPKPLVNGTIKLQKSTLLINYLQTKYSFTSTVTVKDNLINFNNVNIYDKNGNTALLNGKITNNYFRDFYFNLKFDANNFLFLDTKPKDNNLYYGRALASGVVSITGNPKNLSIDVSARTERNTEFYIPVSGSEEINEYTFINFINDKNTSDTVKKKEKEQYQVDLTGLRLNLELEVTPDAEAQIIFDPKVGDIMKGRGTGNIKMEINTLGKFTMYGDFHIEEGDYLFTLQNVINKRFKVEQGGTIEWNGDPLNANIDIKAVYRTKTSLYDLFLQAPEEYKRRIPVECQLFMTNKLMSPDISFDIYLPTADEETRSRVKGMMNTEEELSKQFLSLLVINSFMPDPNMGGMQASTGTGALGAAGVGVTTSELLSNQLSNWLSQISKDFDIGVNYRPGDQISSDEVEVALSTQLLDDRVSINGNLDVGGTQTSTTTSTNTSNIVGDFNVDIKINKSGKLRLKAYNKANDKLMYAESPYTQGVGLFYREEFNTLGQLFKRYWSYLFPRTKEDQKKETMLTPSK